jgi:hypothetical protein
MKKTMARFLLVTAVAIVLVLVCYGLARAYLTYEAARAERMLKELGDVKIGDPESQVLAILQRYGNYQNWHQDEAKFDKADYEYLVEIGPSGAYRALDPAHAGMFYRSTRAVLSGLNPQFRRGIGLRRWNVYGRVGIKEHRVILVHAEVMVEGSHRWLAGDWLLVKAIPPGKIETFVTSPGIPWPHDVNHYLMGWEGRVTMEEKDGKGGGPETWITPAATDKERRLANEFRWNCLTSRSACRTACDLYPAAVEYANSPTLEGKRELCAAPGPSNSYW